MQIRGNLRFELLHIGLDLEVPRRLCDPGLDLLGQRVIQLGTLVEEKQGRHPRGRSAMARERPRRRVPVDLRREYLRIAVQALVRRRLDKLRRGIERGEPMGVRSR
jgi:hypothetical protein